MSARSDGRGQTFHAAVGAERLPHALTMPTTTTPTATARNRPGCARDEPTVRWSAVRSNTVGKDRHQLWRLVEYDYHQFGGDNAPEGHEAIVLVYLIGRDQPVEIGFVETRDAESGGALVRLQALNRDLANQAPGERRRPHPSDNWVHVHSAMISRVEIVYRKKQTSGQTLGFSYDPGPTDE
jgi:hypothetical protein